MTTMKAPRLSLLPGVLLGLCGGLCVMAGYEHAFHAAYDSDDRLLLWIRVPTFGAALGLFAGLAFDTAIRRWSNTKNRAWVLLFWTTGLSALISTAFVSIGGLYFGHMPLPYVGVLRLVLGVGLPVALFAIYVGRLVGGGFLRVILSTLVFAGVAPAIGAWLVAPWITLHSIRRILALFGESMSLVAFGVGIGCCYGFVMGLHLLFCAKSAETSQTKSAM